MENKTIKFNNWDKYLSKKDNILIIGYCDIELINYFRDNNPESIIIIFDIFNNIDIANLSNQIIQYKINSLQEFNKILYENKYDFDIIYIDLFNEQIHIIANCILLWEIIKNNTIMIFNNYNLKIPTNLGLDCFIEIYKSQMKILLKDSELIIKKYIKNIKEDYKKYVIESIRNYKIDIPWYEINIDINSKLIYKLELNKNLPNTNDDNINKIIQKSPSMKKGAIYELNNFLIGRREYEFINNIYPKKINDKISKYKTIPLHLFPKYLYNFLNIITEKNLFSQLATVYNKNLLKFDENNTFKIFVSFIGNYENDYLTIIDILRKYVDNVMIFNLELNPNKNTYLNSKIKNIDELEDIVSKLKNNKQDFIKLRLLVPKDEKQQYKNTYNQEYITAISLFYSILLSLSINKIGGTTCIRVFVFNESISTQLLFLLKKYYNKLITTDDYTVNIYSKARTIIASGFKGIDELELKKLYKIGENIKIHTPDRINYDDVNYHYLINILDINNDNDEYLKFKNEIEIINNKMIDRINKKRKMWNSICDFLENEKNNIYKNDVINEIIIAQFKILIQWALETNFE